MASVKDGVIEFENRLHGQLVRFSIPILRIAVGAVFLGFGVLKFFPNVSPAQNLATKTIEALTLGLVSGGVGIVAIAMLGASSGSACFSTAGCGWQCGCWHSS